MYSVLKAGEKKNTKKAKGVKKCVIKKHINHENYKETLFGGKQSMHDMKMLRSERHDMYSIKMKKASLSAYDNKHWIAEDGITTRAYDYTEPVTDG